MVVGLYFLKYHHIIVLKFSIKRLVLVWKFECLYYLCYFTGKYQLRFLSQRTTETHICS